MRGSSIGSLGVFSVLLASAFGCKETATGVVSEVVKAGKDTAAGIAEGVKEGRREGESTDGAVVVTNGKELTEYLSVTVLGVAPEAEGVDATKVTVALENSGARPVRVTGLAEEGVTLLLDKEGFSHPATFAGSHELTVPPNAKIKAELSAPIKAETASTLRIWEHDLKL